MYDEYIYIQHFRLITFLFLFTAINYNTLMHKRLEIFNILI